MHINLHGSGYCGIQSGLLEGVCQSRPGGEPGKPAIDARRWFLDGIIHSVCDAFYDGRWHYYDIDLGGYAGDAEKDVWSVADVIADPKGCHGQKTTIRSPYFFDADGNGAWVDKIDAAKRYAFQDCHMIGHEMSFSLRPGERFTRYFNQDAAGWSELAPPTKKPIEEMKGYCELVYAPADAAQANKDALAADGGALIFAVRCRSATAPLALRGWRRRFRPCLSVPLRRRPPPRRGCSLPLENLANSGYLLRCWLPVQKLQEIKSKVIDQAK